MAAYERAVGNLPSFRERSGQRAMAQEVARALATAQLGETGEAPLRSIAVVQAGTGVGKSAAYLLVGAAIAMARKTRLMVSTSSVALQEQLIGKDLPMLAATMDPAPKFALAKGRGRYICLTRLASRVGGGDESVDTGEDAAPVSAAQPEAAVVFYRSAAQALQQRSWDGDRDSLVEPAPPNLWDNVAADRHTCTGKSCPQYQACPYFAARRRIAEADVLVVNHDLLLSSIGTRLLPELDNCLLVLDEAHALPQTASEQFACELDLSRLRWLDRATLTVVTGMQQLTQKVDRPVDKIVRELRAALQDSGQITFDNLASGMREKDGVRRLKEQEIDALLREPLRMAQARASELLDVCTTLGQAAREAIQEAGGTATPALASIYAGLGALAGRLSRVKQAADMLLADGEDARTTAKWVSVDARAGRMVAVRLHASPILPGDLLRLNLWGRVRGAVLTSATLATCGSFGFFKAEAGLDGDPAVRTSTVQSPFDYVKQGQLVVRKTASAPRHLDAYNTEVAQLLADDIAGAQAGGLALFTSRRHMTQAFEALPEHLRERVLVQGTMPRSMLLAEHRRRVQAGQASVIMGLQSFGEGLDLPGDLCRHLWITKLPFGSPANPVSEARAEYVEETGGDYFDQVVVPSAGVRLLQWTGRGIRNETDTATITCYDSRLTEKGYGRRLLRGLPPYRLIEGEQGSEHALVV